MPSTPDFNFETSLLPPRTRYLLGIDEVGRGPLAGPLAVGAFLLDLKNFNLEFFIKNKIRDSKTLSHRQRLHALSQFKQINCSYKVFFASSIVIDKLGIQSAILQTVKKAVLNFYGQFDFVLLDGSLDPHLNNLPCCCLPQADQKCFSVASASIVAKVSRDQKMIDFDQIYPNYNFASHKGYGTRSHLQALRQFGPCPIHRRSFRPVAKLIQPG